MGKLFGSIANAESKVNQTVHGSADAAAKTATCIKFGASGIMTAKGVRDYIVSYQCNEMVCLAVSMVGTTADISNQIFGNILALCKLTPVTIYVSLTCKGFVQLCTTGNIRFACK